MGRPELKSFDVDVGPGGQFFQASPAALRHNCKDGFYIGGIFIALQV